MKVTTREAAKLTGFSAPHISRLCKQQRIKAERWGRDWMVELESLEEYIKDWQSRKPGRKKEEKHG